MAKIQFKTMQIAERTPAGGYALMLFAPTGIPEKTIDVATVGEAIAAFGVYKTSCEASGKPVHVYALVRRGDRKPRGFDAAKRDLEAYVNTHLLP